MILSVGQLKELLEKLRAARTDSNLSCHEQRLENGLTYHLEPKPKARRDRLEKNGFEVVDVDGVMHVKIPLGIHGNDDLGIDPETGEIVCLCGDHSDTHTSTTTPQP